MNIKKDIITSIKYSRLVVLLLILNFFIKVDNKLGKNLKKKIYCRAIISIKNKDQEIKCTPALLSQFKQALLDNR